jgi:hypothetical protein
MDVPGCIAGQRDTADQLGGNLLVDLGHLARELRAPRM